MPVPDNEMIAGIFPGKVIIVEGGKLMKPLSASKTVLLEPPIGICEIKKGKTISACLCFLQSRFPQF